jgi:HlyD family secretion protein
MSATISAAGPHAVTAPAGPLPANSNRPAPRALIDYDFKSALAAPPKKRAFLWMMIALVASAATGLWFAKVDMVVTANGRIITSAGDIVVQALETSVVRAVNVKMGQKVSKGDVLATLDPTFTQADQDELGAKLHKDQAALDRLTAEAAGRVYNPAKPNPEEAIQLDIFRKRQAEYAAHVTAAERKIEQYKADLVAHKTEAEGLKQQIGLAGQADTIYQSLVASQLASKLKAIDTKRSLVEAQSRLDTNQGEQQKLVQQIAGAAADREAFIQEWRRKLGEELAQTQSDRDSNAARLSKAQLRHELAVMTAPEDATVLDVAQRPAGSVMREAEVLMRLVPADRPLQAEVQVDTRDVARLHVGDPVTLKFEALPWQQYGLAHGTLVSLTPDTLEDDSARETAEDMTASGMKQQARQSPIHYRARVAITDTKFRNLPDDFAIRPGMRLTGDVKIGRRSVLDYVLNPITRVIDESMREP